MENKERIIIIGLIVLLIIVFIWGFLSSAGKEALKREFEFARGELQKENELLAQKASVALEEKRRAESKLDEVTRQLDSISQQKVDLEKKYELAVREKELLMEKLKSMPSPAQHTAKLPSLPKPEIEDAYLAGVLKEKMNLEMRLDQFKEQINALKAQVEELKNSKVNLELELRNVTQEKQYIERKLAYSEKLIDSISLELMREKKDKRSVESELKALKNEHRMAIRRINNLNGANIALENRLQQIQTEKNELEEKLKQTNSALERKILEIEEAKEKLVPILSSKESPSPQSVELPPIVVRSGETSGTEEPQKEITSLSGRVLAVNKEHNFIVIDLGEEQAVKVGDTFNVYRDNQKIATVEVIQIRKNISACDIRQQSTSIKVGDTVK